MTTLSSRLHLNARTHLGENPYPGRIIIIGLNEKRQVVILYAIMGRSANSQNRLFEHDGHRLRTVPVDPAKVQDPELIIYDAMGHMAVYDGLDDSIEVFFVTNGRQTSTLLEQMRSKSDFAQVLNQWDYEPDNPNFTPRISGMVTVRQHDYPHLYLSVIKQGAGEVNGHSPSQRHMFETLLEEPSLGFCISTYRGDGNPLPSFEGEPIQVPLEGSADNIAKFYWDMLNPDYRVSLAVQVITPSYSLSTEWRVINRHDE